MNNQPTDIIETNKRRWINKKKKKTHEGGTGEAILKLFAVECVVLLIAFALQYLLAETTTSSSSAWTFIDVFELHAKNQVQIDLAHTVQSQWECFNW